MMRLAVCRMRMYLDGASAVCPFVARLCCKLYFVVIRGLHVTASRLVVLADCVSLACRMRVYLRRPVGRLSLCLSLLRTIHFQPTGCFFGMIRSPSLHTTLQALGESLIAAASRGMTQPDYGRFAAPPNGADARLHSAAASAAAETLVVCGHPTKTRLWAKSGVGRCASFVAPLVHLMKSLSLRAEALLRTSLPE